MVQLGVRNTHTFEHRLSQLNRLVLRDFTSVTTVRTTTPVVEECEKGAMLERFRSEDVGEKMTLFTENTLREGESPYDTLFDTGDQFEDDTPTGG